MAKYGIHQLAYYLVLIGGILLIVFSLLGLVGVAISIPFHSSLGGMNFGFALLPLILGIIAVVGAKHASELLWAIVLIIVGYIAGGIGGLLVLIGGIIGLLTRFIH